MKKKNNSVLFLMGIFLLLVLVNLLGLENFFRIDLTKDGKYTLSRASVETVRNLDDTITVSAYFTEGLPPPYAQHARYVKDLLEEYRAASDGSFAFEFTDPSSYETAEDRAKKKELKRDILGRVIREPTSVETELNELGLQPVEIRVIKDDQQQTQRAYMGMVIRYQEKHEVIPVVQNLSDLEKNMTSLMRKLTRIREPKLAVVKDIAGPNIENMTKALGQNMKVENIDLKTTDDISEEFDALIVIGDGAGIEEDDSKKINRFLAKGKSASFFIDRYKIDPQTFQQGRPGSKQDSNSLLQLIKGYGFDIHDGLVADASCASLNVQESRGGFVFSLPIKYPFVPELLNLSYESPITTGISGVIMPFVSSIGLLVVDGMPATVLARSSKVSWIENEPLNLDPRRDWGQLDIVPGGPYILMASARGALPMGTDADSLASKKEIDSENAEGLESRVVVAGTSAFLWDEFLTPANQVLALNIADWMLADAALLEMRSREFADAPLDAEISDVFRQSVKYGNIFGVPLLLILYGIIRWRVRESRRRSIRMRA